MQNMHKSMYLHILHIYALPTLLMTRVRVRLAVVSAARASGGLPAWQSHGMVGPGPPLALRYRQLEAWPGSTE